MRHFRECGVLALKLNNPNTAKRQPTKKGKLKFGNVILGEWKGGYSSTSNRPDFSILRMREIEAVIKHRHGSILEQTDDAFIYVEAAASSLRNLDHLISWCARWCPWAIEVGMDEIQSAFNKYENQKRDPDADKIAQLLHVKFSERQAIGLKTIGCCDLSKQERTKLTKELKRNRDRERQKARRRSIGVRSREEYLAQCSHGKPWEKLGISRATWYRAKKRNETGPSHIDNKQIVDEPVSNFKI